MSLLSNLPDVNFAVKDPEQILNDMVKGYEEAYYKQTGKRKTLYPGDPIRIFLYSQALKEFQLRVMIDNAAKQNLLKYATGDFLDNLAALRNVKRLEASKASVNVKFTLSAPQNTVQIIPRGTRVSPGNNIYFETVENIEVPIGATEIVVYTECKESGTIGNGFIPGQINILVDPLPWIAKVENIETSQGGAEKEDDESLRERVYLAPESYSVAGPTGAYEFFAKEYSSAIEDVKVSSPTPGTVDIRILLQNGELPSEAFIQGVQEYLNDNTKRPLTDNVVVGAPEVVNYNIELTYYILEKDSKISTVIQERVAKAVEDYIRWQKSKIGRDINPSELIAKVVNAGAKRVEVISPVFTTLEDTQVAYAENVVVNFGGVEND